MQKKQFQDQIKKLEHDRELDWHSSIYVIEDCFKQKIIFDPETLFYSSWEEAVKKQGELTERNGGLYRVVEYARHVS